MIPPGPFRLSRLSGTVRARRHKPFRAYYGHRTIVALVLSSQQNILIHMPKVFYVGGGTHTRGILRAVISTAELVIVTVGVDAHHVGPHFPNEPCARSGVLVEVSFSEANSSWRRGFYRLE